MMLYQKKIAHCASLRAMTPSAQRSCAFKCVAFPCEASTSSIASPAVLSSESEKQHAGAAAVDKEDGGARRTTGRRTRAGAAGADAGTRVEKRRPLCGERLASAAKSNAPEPS